MWFMLETERLIIQPYSNSFLEEYYKEFTDEITKYQYPDSFSNINTANEIVSGFVKDMEQGNMLELVILSHKRVSLSEAWKLLELKRKRLKSDCG